MILFGVEIDEEAICPIGKVHSFTVTEDITDNGKYVNGAVVENCNLCGEQRIYKKWQGRIDNMRHARNRIRDIIQPNGKTKDLFEYIYGIIK